MKKFTISLFLIFLFIYALLADNKKPSWKTNHINGYATECMMDKFFLYNDNWQKIEGEYGRNGIDGLYIKQKNNIIKEVLITESKYNRSHLGYIKKGTIKQMSKEWILAKLKILQKYHKNSPYYKQLITHVKNNHYRARLFKLKPVGSQRFKIILYRIKNKDDACSLKKIKISELTIDFEAPKESFEQEMVKAFRQCHRYGTSL
jgi:hypothetical protein